MENGEDTLECITRHCIDGFVRGGFTEFRLQAKMGLPTTLYLTDDPAAYLQRLISN